MKCSQCGFENDQDAKFCEQCGASFAKICPECGSPLKPGAKFCKKCGARAPSGVTPNEDHRRLAALQQTAPPALQEKIRSISTEIEGERKPVTILFTDIVGSTSLAEKLDPEEWKEIVAGAHQRVSKVVYLYEGTIAQLLGDGVLAFFGAPITHEDDPLRAVHAALDIQKMIADYERELQGYIDSFQIRIGINTGTVVVGNLGSDLHMEYLAIGDAVNLAARLQSAARPGGILISESTAHLVKASFELHPLGEISLKGKAEPLSVFEVLKAKVVPESSRGFEELHSPLVGRDHELGLLHKALISLSKGHGQIAAIIGEAGIGKSRLIEEVRQIQMEGLEKLHWIEGRALSYGQGLSFWSITQLLYSDLGLSDGDPEARIRAALKKRSNELFGEQAAEALPYLLHLSGVPLGEDQGQQIKMLDGETLKRQLLITTAQYFERLAQKQPTVVVFEDFHWIDPSSLEELEILLAATDRSPIMLLLISRCDRERPCWQVKLKAETEYAHRYTEISLKPLSGNEQNLLVDNLLALAELPENVKRLILERSEGNPFFLEEVIRSLIDQGALLHEAGRWHPARDIQNLSIPETLQGVLLARIDRLQEDVRRTLQLASVIGKSFLYRLLEAISQAEQQLDRHMALLQRADLVLEKSRIPELEYIFKHSLTQEAAYNSLLLERRKEFHRRVGETLERLFADRQDQFLGLLAHHFEASGEHTRAVDYLIRAGDQARLTDEHTEAIDYYRRAIKLLDEWKDENRAAQVWLKLGLIYHANFQFEESHEAYEIAFRLRQKSQVHKPIPIDPELKIFRKGVYASLATLDPGICKWQEEFDVIRALFSGLARINEDMDVIPEIARSWQVLDGGRRYIFHLRDDFTWSDGTPVTAADFEWAWKRNLDPRTTSDTIPSLYDIVGARDYHLGINPDPGCVGVHALDTCTLEVILLEPVAYFPFVVTQPDTYPLPRVAIQRYGEDWWKPGQIVSNGAFQLVEFDNQYGCSAERAPEYPLPINGNIGRVEWKLLTDPHQRARAYMENSLDFTKIEAFWGLHDFPKQEAFLEPQTLNVAYLIINPTIPPLDDPRVRKAIGQSIDVRRFHERYQITIAHGGLVPPGMPGHSPDIGLPYDLELARNLLTEAGYPGGRGFPALSVVAPHTIVRNYADEFQRQWYESLGIEVVFQGADVWQIEDFREKRLSGSMVFSSWLADYPDPDNFLRQCEAIAMLNYLGWCDTDYDRLVEQAARTSDRAKRLAMYRQADRRLVQEQALIVPLSYGGPKKMCLIKPWVKNARYNRLEELRYQNIIIEEH